MKYFQRNRPRYKYLKKTSILLGVFVLVVLVFSLFGNIIITTASPVWKAENVVSRSLRNSAGFFLSRKALMDENSILRDRVASLEAEVLSMSRELSQEGALLELVGRIKDSHNVAAAVLTHPPQTPYDVLIIDAGSDHGVVLGSEVSLPEGPLLGKVSEVLAKTSKVRLFSAVDEETNAVLERGDMAVTLVGVGGGNFKISVPRDTQVEVGDRVLSADISSSLVAVVEDVSLRPTDSFKEVLAKSPTNIFSLRFVFVLP